MGEPLLVVMEYCEHGSLVSCLRDRDMPHHTRRLVALDGARGLEYLAQRGIVHRDVAARNVMVSPDFRGRLADFGMSRETHYGQSDSSAYYRSAGGIVPVRYARILGGRERERIIP
jgi:serine/threonine protein kinase